MRHFRGVSSLKQKSQIKFANTQQQTLQHISHINIPDKDTRVQQI